MDVKHTVLVITDAHGPVLGINKPALGFIEALYNAGFTIIVYTAKVGPASRYFEQYASVIGSIKRMGLVGEVLDAVTNRGLSHSGFGLTMSFSNQVKTPVDVYYFSGFLKQVAKGYLLPLKPLLARGDAAWRRALAASGTVVAISQSAAAQYEKEMGVRPPVVYPPFPTWQLEKLLGINNDRGDYYLVYLGKETASPCAVKSIRHLMRVFPGDWRGFGKNVLRQRVVETFPIVPEDEVHKIYADAKAVFFVYCNATEPFGLVPTEAILAGKPAVAVGSPTEGPYEQATVLKYPIAWYPEAAMVKQLPKPPTWNERVRVAENHKPQWALLNLAVATKHLLLTATVA